MSKYLYGAAVQGIQDFIFQTNKLREIIGASDLVEYICTDLFAQVLLNNKDASFKDINNTQGTILNAAGNIKYIFNSREECQKVFRIFPLRVREEAPGVTISQAAVEIPEKENISDYSSYFDKLEEKLKVQRNKPVRNLTYGKLCFKRSRQTGLPIVKVGKVKEMGKDQYEEFDLATYKKLFIDDNWNKRSDEGLFLKSFGQLPKDKRPVLDTDKMTGNNNWIAVIHIDGNGLGKVVQKIGKDLERFKNFSRNLDKATTEAARIAFSRVYLDFNLDNSTDIPIRPIILGGDDLTVICRGDIALPFATAFLKAFEEKTHLYLGDDLKRVFNSGLIREKLTACGGISYIKASFPFYFAYSLAEELCKAAKDNSKNSEAKKRGQEIPASCLLFHRVQDSFVSDFKDIKERELSVVNNLSLCFGPYFLNEEERTDNHWTIERLQKTVCELAKDDGSAKSSIRRWLSAIHKDANLASLILDRTIKNNKALERTIKDCTTAVDGLIPAYDILTLYTINYQETNN